MHIGCGRKMACNVQVAGLVRLLHSTHAVVIIQLPNFYSVADGPAFSRLSEFACRASAD